MYPPAYGAPTTSAPAYSSPTQAPTLANPNGGAAPQTFQPNSNGQQDNSLRPIQPPADPSNGSSTSEPKINSSSSPPRLLDPQNRTTMRPLFGPTGVMPAIFRSANRPTSIKPASLNIQSASGARPNDDGWRQGER
jgi:hypothetical protein